MKTFFSKTLNRTILKTTISITPENYYGYPTFKTEGYEFYLSYNDGSIRFNFCKYNSNGYKSGGSSTPIESLNNNKEWTEFAKILILRDKKRGIIPNTYTIN